MRFARRSWGYYIVLLNREHFKVKLLRFTSGKKCSRQYHDHRNELWLMLKGWGSMRVGDKMTDIKPGEYRHVPIGVHHKFVAIETSWFIEIQYGDLCEEEDIVRV